MVGYNAQAAVDHKNKLIVAEDVTNEETDLRQLSGMAKQAKANLGVGKLEVVADTGYCTTAEVAQCEEHGHHGLRAQSRYQREHGAGIIWQKPFHLRPPKGCVCVSGGGGTDVPVQHL